MRCPRLRSPSAATRLPIFVPVIDVISFETITSPTPYARSTGGPGRTVTDYPTSCGRCRTDSKDQRNLLLRVARAMQRSERGLAGNLDERAVAIARGASRSLSCVAVRNFSAPEKNAGARPRRAAAWVYLRSATGCARPPVRGH